ncbi:hypothetical protein JD79_03360 [Geodermatophilus normandii]|uniref:N,N-dimethylformamidase alpha subunit domain-containing protein n=1 Tax=Geodermatophilus normandii TaxID=1137989 RepID=A0A317QLD6_9ACTN|nr:hypothetical protein [Geodermatophilus normandii]PWW24182.1 hypothetical protein JD79_03360 [Geodermatophilus normandii]
MPLSDPTATRDKSEDWLAEFRRRRVEALRPLVTPELVEAHRANPRGPHSHELNLVLNFVRGPAEPMDGKPFVHLRVPYTEYGLALMQGRGEPVVHVEGAPYASETEAVHAAFLQRLAAHGLDGALREEDGDV